MEEENKIHSPIVHSMQRDTIRGAQNVVGSNDVPAEEALLLAKMQSASFKKRQVSILSVVGILFLILGTGFFILPDKFFAKKDTGITVSKTKNQNFIGVDASYNMKLPTGNEISNFKKKTFAGEPGISEIIINDENNNVVPLKKLAPLLAERFLTNIIPITNGEYVYGYYTNKDLKSYPYFIFSTNDQHTAEANLLNEERVMYTDLSNILMLPENKENEILQFESGQSVRIPTRLLPDRSGKELMVYGFPVENVVLFTTSIEAYNALRNRILIGY